MFNLLKRAGKRAAPPAPDTTPSAPPQSKKLGQSTEFKGKVLKAKLEIIAAVKNADKQRALDSLNVLSMLTAETIYEHDLHAMFLINNAIDDINHTIDLKLQATGEPSDFIEDVEETKMYMMIRLTMLPVMSMMSAIQGFSNTGMNKVNSDIDSRIRQIQMFVMEHER